MNEELELLSRPGDTLLETIDYMGISRELLAQKMGKPVMVIDEIIDGKAVIDFDKAYHLEKALGISSDFWLNREKNYRKKLTEALSKEKITMESESKFEEVICPECGVSYNVPKVVIARREATGGQLMCYNGHAYRPGAQQNDELVEKIEAEYLAQVNTIEKQLAEEKERHSLDLMVLQKGLTALNSQLKSVKHFN